MRRFPWFLLQPCRLAALPLGITAWPRCQSMRQGGQTGYCHERNQNSRGNLPPRPLAVRARADAGLLGQYQRQARRRRLAGDADQRLARLARPGAAVAACAPTANWSPAMPRPRKCRCTPRSTRPAAAARAVVHLHSTHSVALSMLPEIDPRAALPPMTRLLPDEVRRRPRWCRIIGPAIPRSPTRSRGWPENIPRCCSPITARWCPATRWKPRCSRSRNWKRRRSSICCCAG